MSPYTTGGGAQFGSPPKAPALPSASHRAPARGHVPSSSSSSSSLGSAPSARAGAKHKRCMKGNYQKWGFPPKKTRITAGLQLLTARLCRFQPRFLPSPVLVPVPLPVRPQSRSSPGPAPFPTRVPAASAT